jgi:hypothetical protein
VRKRKALDWLLERVEIVDEDGRAIDRADLEISPQTDEHGSDEDDVPGNETGAAGSETTSDESTDESDETDGKEMETDPR